MHSWHCALFASTAPSSAGEENCESGMPATFPAVFRSRFTVLVGKALLAFPGVPGFASPGAAAYGTVSASLSRRAPTASNFSRPKPIGSIRLWQRGTARIAGVLASYGRDWFAA